MKFAHKKFTISIDRIKDDGWLNTIDGLQPVNKGNLIATDELGNQSVLTEEYFFANYIPVEKLTDRFSSAAHSSLSDEYARKIIAFNNLYLQHEEDEVYIQGTKELHKKDNWLTKWFD